MWEESKHKRGQPKNAGQFGPGGGAAAGSTTKERPSGPKVTAQQRAALEWYSGDGWIQVNAALRGEKDVLGQDPRDPKEFATTIRHLDGAIAAAGESAAPMKLYRGVRVPDPEAFVRGVETGKVISMRGYQSTSTDVGVAVSSGNVLLRIQSSRGLPMKGLTKNPGEREVLLGRDWQYEVVEKQSVSFRGRQLYALVLRVREGA